MYLFWFLILPICFFISGIICMIVSNKKPNHFIGYRTKDSIINEDVWKFANYRFGVLALRISIIMFLANMIFYALGLHNDCLRNFAFLIIFIDLAMFFPPIFVVENEIKKKFEDLEPSEYSKFLKILIIITMFILLVFLFLGKNEINYNNNILTINALMYTDFKINLKDIKKIELRNDFDYGYKIIGINNIAYSQGEFTNNEIDKYLLYVFVENKTSILLHLKDNSLVVFNKQTKEETNELYDILIKDFNNIQK